MKHYEMKHYKEFTKIYIGDSDIASLILRGPDKLAELRFGGDNSYFAYECFGDVVIGNHYTKVFESSTWLSIYDDHGRVYENYRAGESVRVFRAGDYGCIIHWGREDPKVEEPVAKEELIAEELRDLIRILREVDVGGMIDVLSRQDFVDEFLDESEGVGFDFFEVQNRPGEVYLYVLPPNGDGRVFCSGDSHQRADAFASALEHAYADRVAVSDFWNLWKNRKAGG